MEALTSLIHEDATQSMPPFDLWLRGREDIFTWWVGPGVACRGSRVDGDDGRERLARVRAVQAERDREAASTRGRCRCSRSRHGRIVELTFFLDTERVFPLFGLPPRLDD